MQYTRNLLKHITFFSLVLTELIDSLGLLLLWRLIVKFVIWTEGKRWSGILSVSLDRNDDDDNVCKSVSNGYNK